MDAVPRLHVPDSYGRVQGAAHDVNPIELEGREDSKIKVWPPNLAHVTADTTFVPLTRRN